MKSNTLPLPQPQVSALAFAFQLIGGKHKACLVWELRAGSLRFSQLRARAPGLSESTLIKLLRELTAAGLLTRTIFAVIPSRVEYALTEPGRALLPALAALAAWGQEWPPAT